MTNPLGPVPPFPPSAPPPRRRRGLVALVALAGAIGLLTLCTVVVLAVRSVGDRAQDLVVTDDSWSRSSSSPTPAPATTPRPTPTPTPTPTPDPPQRLTDAQERVEITVPADHDEMTSDQAGELAEDQEGVDGGWQNYVPDIEASSYEVYVSVGIFEPLPGRNSWKAYHDDLAGLCSLEDCEVQGEAGFVQLEHHEARQTRSTGTFAGEEYSELVTTISTEELLVQIGVTGPTDEASLEEMRAITDSVEIQ